MSIRGYTEPAAVLEIAAELLLATEQLETDMRDPDLHGIIAGNLELAGTLGIAGTPALVIGDRLIHGAMPRERLLALIAEEREPVRR